MSWETLRERLAEPVITHETMAEYRRMSREDQLRIKDVGGFVGGYLRDGIRKGDHIAARSVVTLDYDSFTEEALERMRGTLDLVWAIHSTHKHSAEEWRVRVIIPTDRDMSPEEYGAVSRRLAERIGMTGIDRSTFEPCRLMFWPSRPKDAPYLFEESSGDRPFADVDALLSEYRDWRDISEWPRTEEEESVVTLSEGGAGDKVQEELERMARQLRAGSGNTKMQDPMEKKGLIGAFCRTHDIHSAIDTYLQHVYTRDGKHPNRYTYIGGSTHGGAWVLDGGRFLHSFHATDPISGMSVNAWDLVRLHLFGDRDTGAKLDRNADRRPSYKAMEELAMGDRRVKSRLMDERRQEAAEAFADIEIPEPEEEIRDEVESKWEEMKMTLACKKNGSLQNSLSNITAVLRFAPEFAGKIRKNLFADTIELHGRMPWKREKSVTLNNEDLSCLQEYLDRIWDLSGAEKISTALTVAASENRYHPVKEYLDSLEWDGEERLSRLFTDVLGAEDTALNRELPRLFCTGAVKRIYEPGCKFDYFIILQGVEGSRKSTFFRVLGGAWFTDSVPTLEGTKGMEYIQGKWIAEIGELIGVKRTEGEQVKAFISRQVDIWRPAYGRVKEEHPRQCVLAGTTNEELFLRGIATGNRRSPIVEINPELKKIEGDIEEWLVTHRDQLWAEAKELWKGGYRVWLDEDLEMEARKIALLHNLDYQNPLFGEVDAILERWLPPSWEALGLEERRQEYRKDPEKSVLQDWTGYFQRRTVTCAEILQEALGIDRNDREYWKKSKELGQYMSTKKGWRKKGSMRTKLFGVQQGWERVQQGGGDMNSQENPENQDYTLNDL